MLKFVLTAVYLALLVGLLYQPIQISEDDPINENIQLKTYHKVKSKQQKIAGQELFKAKDSVFVESRPPVNKSPFQAHSKIISLNRLHSK